MEKCTKTGYNKLIVKGKCLNGQNYFLNGRIQKHENDKESNSNGTGFHDGPVFSRMRKLFHNSNNSSSY